MRGGSWGKRNESDLVSTVAAIEKSPVTNERGPNSKAKGGVDHENPAWLDSLGGAGGNKISHQEGVVHDVPTNNGTKPPEPLVTSLKGER